VNVRMATASISAPDLPSGSRWKTEGYGVTPGEPKQANGADEKEETKFVYRGHTDDRPLIWRQPLNDLVSTINEVGCDEFSLLDPSFALAELGTQLFS
jgi:hypothetical protein